MSYDDEISTRKIGKLLVNKRLFAVAYPQWLRSFHVETEQEGAILAELATNRQTALRVKELDLQLPLWSPPINALSSATRPTSLT